MASWEQDSNDKYIQALKDISRAITSDLFLEDLLKLIVMVTAKVMDVEICSLWILDEEENPCKIRLKATQAISPDYVQDRSLDLNEGVVGEVITSKQPLVIKKVVQSERFKEKEMAKKLGLESMLGVPLQLKNEQVIGALNCFTSEPHDFTQTEIDLLTTVANQAAVAILNTELMVKKKVIQEELETTHELFKGFVQRYRSGLDLEQVANGDHWYAEQAVSLNLVDTLQTSDDLIMDCTREADVFEVTYERKQGMGKRLVLGVETALQRLISRSG